MKKFSRYAAAALFLGAGFLHLVRPAPFAAIVPNYVPRHLAVVYIGGIAELAGGIGLLLRRTYWLAAWGLALLLVAVFPANVYMAMNHVQISAKPLPDYVLWGRLFLQPLLIWWVLSLRQSEK
jgi:uncharacterized membrane protein